MNIKIGAKIKELRKSNDITQEQLAAALGVSNQAVSKWEKENGYPDIEYILAIADFFNVTTDYLFDHIQSDKQFTDAEKESCMPVIQKIHDLAQLCRKKGILSLELEIPEEKSVFLKTAVQLVVDSADPEIVKKHLQNLIQAGNYSGAQLLSRQLMIAGVLAIADGCNPRQITFELLTMLGEEYLERIDEIKPEDKSKPYVDLVNAFNERKAFPESVPFEDKFMSFTKRSIRYIMLFGGIDNICLVRALYGCGFELIQTVLDNVSQNKCMRICEDLLSLHSADPYSSAAPDSVMREQNKILERAEELEKSGNIIRKP